MTTLKDRLPNFLQIAEANFKKDGYLTPVFIGEIDGKSQILILNFQNQEDKDAIATQIQTWIAEGKLTEYIMVIEAWAAETLDMEAVQGHLEEHGSLESWPNRKEIASITYHSATEEISYTTDIIRGTINDKPSLGEWFKIEKKTKFNMMDSSIRFNGLFLKGKAAQN
jgi:hypothetical protein